MTPNEFVLNNAPWSVSKADVARDCPKRFKFQYVEKLKMATGRGFEASTGKMVHRALELAVSGIPMEKAFDRAISEVTNVEPLSTTELEDVRSYLSASRAFLGKFTAYKQRHGGADPKMEQRLAVDLSGASVPFFGKNQEGRELAFLRGVIDLYMLFTGKNTALILDHKTGKYKEIEHFRAQFDMYLLLLKSAYPHLEFVQLGINFLKVGRIELAQKMEDVRDVEPIRDRLIRFLNDSTRETSDLERTKPGRLCGWCEYQSICPAHAGVSDGGINEKEKGSDPDSAC